MIGVDPRRQSAGHGDQQPAFGFREQAVVLTNVRHTGPSMTSLPGSARKAGEQAQLGVKFPFQEAPHG